MDLLWGSLKLELWRLYLVLKGFSVMPMYIPCFIDSVCVTIALYTTPS